MFKNRPIHMKFVESGGLFLINNRKLNFFLFNFFSTENLKIVGKIQHKELVQLELGVDILGATMKVVL